MAFKAGTGHALIGAAFAAGSAYLGLGVLIGAAFAAGSAYVGLGTGMEVAFSACTRGGQSSRSPAAGTGNGIRRSFGPHQLRKLLGSAV